MSKSFEFKVCFRKFQYPNTRRYKAKKCYSPKLVSEFTLYSLHEFTTKFYTYKEYSKILKALKVIVSVARFPKNQHLIMCISTIYNK